MDVGRRRAHGTVFDMELANEMLYTDENLNMSGQSALSHAALFLHEHGKRISGHDVVVGVNSTLFGVSTIVTTCTIGTGIHI